MAPTVSLAPGQTIATSSEVAVLAGATASIGIYTETGTKLSAAGSDFFATVVMVTPGEPSQIGRLDASKAAMSVAGPGTYKVIRNACKVNVGVFSEV